MRTYPTHVQKETLNYAAELIARAGSLVIAAGAGIGVDSGLPDFRGTSGFWGAYPSLGRRGIDFESIANPAQFDDNPYLAWGFYGHRLQIYRHTRPHAGYDLLRRWGESAGHQYSVFTSNVDGHFARAGFDTLRLHECHGSIHHLQCTVPCSDEIWTADSLQVNVEDTTGLWQGELPHCPGCGALARPNILMFSDSAWIDQRSRVQAETQERWLGSLVNPVVIEIGAGTAINTVRRFSGRMVKSAAALLIRINPDPGQDDSADVTLDLPALQALREIEHRMAQHTRNRATRKLPPSPVELARVETYDVPVARKSAAGKQQAEHTVRRRIALIGLLPEAPKAGIGITTLTHKLGPIGYPCVRRTVERDLEQLARDDSGWRNLGIVVEFQNDPLHSRGRVWRKAEAARSAVPAARAHKNQATGASTDLNGTPCEPICLVLRCSADRAGLDVVQAWRDAPLSTEQRIVALPDGGHVVSAVVAYSRPLIEFLRAMGHAVQVQCPMELRRELHTYFAHALQRYEQG